MVTDVETTPETSRRDAIVATATTLMLEHGYHGTPVGDIARELGISKAAITYYFPTKDTLLDEIIAPALTAFETHVPVITRPRWSDDARTVCAAYLDVLIEHRDIALWIDRDPALTSIGNHEQRRTAINTRVLRAIHGPRHKAADRARALAVLGGLLRPARELDTPQLIAQRDEIVDAALISYAPL